VVGDMIRLHRRATLARAPVSPPAVESRPRFHHDLDALEEQMRDMADCARRALELSMQALAESDTLLAESVIASDDDIDRRYQEIEERAIDLMGRQQPVASDLRLLVALIHVALHLERLGDMAVNVAEATRAAASLPPMAKVRHRLRDMGSGQRRAPDRPPGSSLASPHDRGRHEPHELADQEDQRPATTKPGHLRASALWIMSTSTVDPSGRVKGAGSVGYLPKTCCHVAFR
jgi:PhoU domain